MSKKTILIVQRSPPYGSSHAKEALDLALAAGTFEQEVDFLLTGDACYQLQSNQEPSQIHQKSLGQMMKALPIYGVETILVDRASLEERRITNIDPALSIKLVDQSQIKQLYQQAGNVIRF
jgi:tRNA 2-thiouridine synthesizing protein C